MNTDELVARVKEVVKDESFDDAEILSRLNDALLTVAFEFCLPELEATDDLTFTVGGDTFASLPDDYHHDLWHIEPQTWRGRVAVMTSLHSLKRLYVDSEAGQICHAAVGGKTLHVRPMPTEESTVTISYYRMPEALVVSAPSATPAVVANSPEGIPSHLHQLLADKVASDIFDIIEDGVDGNKTNTNRYEQRYAQGLLALAQYARRSPRLMPYVKRHPRWF